MEDNDIILEELAISENFTVRSLNVCRCNGLTSLFKILHYYIEHENFLKITNCGPRSNIELTNLCKKYSHYFTTNLIQGENEIEFGSFRKESVLSKINSLSPIQKAALDRQLEYLVSKLNIRLINGLKLISELLEPNEIFGTIFSEKFRINDLKRIGAKSILNFKKFKLNISEFISLIQNTSQNDLNKIYSKLIIKNTFIKIYGDLEQQLNDVFDEKGNLKLFLLLKLLIESSQMFSKVDILFFHDMFSFENNKHKTLEAIAKEVNLTRERVRQKKIIFEKSIRKKFWFISNFVIRDLTDYGQDYSIDCIVIDNDFSKKINNIDVVNFNSKFYSLIFGIILNKTHTTLGDEEIIFGKRKFNHYYLINSAHFKHFRFENFLKNLYLKIKERYCEPISLNFKVYLSEYIQNSGLMFFYDIYLTCEKIIFYEFDLIVNSHGKLIFEQNTKKRIHYYAIEILEENKTVMHLKDICAAINLKYPELKITEQTLRSSIQREKENFIYFGRSSTYGLRIWENGTENIKGGTIRKLVEEFLNKENFPKHISEIMDYVNLYRPKTNEKNIITNIKADTMGKFCFYDGEFVGLHEKKYEIEISEFVSIKGSNFRNKVLMKMVGWDINKVIKYFVSKYGYKEVQVHQLIQNKIEKGQLLISSKNKLLMGVNFEK